MGSVSRNIVVVAATAVFLAAVTAAALMLGASSVSLPELATWLFGGDVSATARNILENVRVPRVLAALLAGAALAVAATDDRAVNRAVGEEARALGIPVSVADCPEECTFFFPAVCTGENLVAGVIGRGDDHARTARAARAIRSALEGLE